VFGIIFLAKEHDHGLGAIFHTAGAGSGGYAGAFLAAALFSVWIFYGFEACGDVAEEVVNPSTRIPRAMQLTLIVGGVTVVFISFQLVVLASLLARQRGWRATGAFTLGRYGPLVNIVALVYGVATIVILSDKTPASVANPGFFDRWLVPISAAIVAAVGLAYLFVFQPKAVVRPDARGDGGTGEEVETPAVPAD